MMSLYTFHRRISAHIKPAIFCGLALAIGMPPLSRVPARADEGQAPSSEPGASASAAAQTVPSQGALAPLAAAAMPQAAPPLSHGSGAFLGARVVLLARPLDSNRRVTAVRFMLDGVMLAEQGAPGRWLWDTRGLRPGRHVVQVQAFEGQQFVGLSEPTVVYVGQQPTGAAAVPTLEIPFFTYELDPRRAAEFVAPKIAAASAPIAEAGTAGSPRVASLVVEVYLNGVKQQFAPAARVASADELWNGATSKHRSRSTRLASRARQRSYDKRVTLIGTQSDRTVWLPARPLLERLGAQITWRPKSGVLVADLNIAGAPRRILLSARGENASQAEIGGHRVALGTPVRLAENALMVPLSFCSDALDLRVRWQKDSHRVEMFTPIAPA